MTPRNIQQSAKVILRNKTFRNRFLNIFPSGAHVIKNFNEGALVMLLRQELHDAICKAVPSVFKIGEVLFLEGETQNKYGYHGDETNSQPLIELFDMEHEFKTGNGSSLYVSSTDWFDFASDEETLKVIEFLKL